MSLAGACGDATVATTAFVLASASDCSSSDEVRPIAAGDGD